MILAHFDAQDYDIDRRMFQALMNDYQITAYSVRKELPAVITAFDIIFLDFGGTPHDEYPNWINKMSEDYPNIKFVIITSYNKEDWECERAFYSIVERHNVKIMNRASENIIRELEYAGYNPKEKKLNVTIKDPRRG